MHDVLIIGAGLGGLVSAAKLARAGKRVLVLEKKPRAGGTSSIFKRGGYAFPMGPLSFSHPGRVRDILSRAGVEIDIPFRRCRFGLLTPAISLEFSRPLEELKRGLKDIFPREALGLDIFFAELRKMIEVVRDLDRWHPDYAIGPDREAARRKLNTVELNKFKLIQQYARTPADTFLRKLIVGRDLRNFLGSMGSEGPEMSVLNLALMWQIMAEEGIWFPEGGVHRLADCLKEACLAAGGEILCSEAVEKILVRNGRAAAVRTTQGTVHEARSVISNADYKTTFLSLLDASDVPMEFRKTVAGVPYTGSELCVFLGIDASRADLSRLQTDHLIYRQAIKSGQDEDLEDFENREAEISLWSGLAPELTPQGRAALVLRVGFPYSHFEPWRTGEKCRKDGYRDYKKRLAQKLVSVVEAVIPGLAGAAEVMEVTTPLTYRDWEGRFQGSIAGWSWAAGETGRLPGKLLVESPLPGLFMAGIYSATELFLGGVPTALFTGHLAADAALGYL